MRLRPAYAAIFFFVSLAIIGGYILDDYGISWDEAIQRRHGRVSLDYAADKLGLDHQALEPTFDLEDYQWSNYGMIYQIAASLLELRWGYDDPYQYYRLRHVINYVLYLLALMCFYRMLRLRWPDRPWYPLLGTILLVLSPRIFAHAFFNPKDHILLVFYLIASFTLLRFLRYRSWPSLMVHALATAIALNTRLPALVILAATVAILVWESVSERKRISRRLGMAGAYAVLSILLMIPFFPYLWEDTLHRLVGALSEMSDFDWGGTNLLFGDRLSAIDVPAYYIPAWIVITTPVMYVLLSLTGIFRALRTIVQGLPRGKLWTDYTGQCDFVHLGLSVGPILVVILLHSTLYNGWRHMHFVYPSLIFLALVGYDGWRQKYPRATAGLLLVTVLVTAVNMVRYHPHQQIYFNYLIHGEPLITRFDMDYWGVGYRDALMQLAATVPDGETIRVVCGNWPCQDNARALPHPQRERIRLEWSAEHADFLITNFQNGYGDKAFRREGIYQSPMIEIKPAGILTIGVYKLEKSY